MTPTPEDYASALAEIEYDEAVEREATERMPVIVRPAVDEDKDL